MIFINNGDHALYTISVSLFLIWGKRNSILKNGRIFAVVYKTDTKLSVFFRRFLIVYNAYQDHPKAYWHGSHFQARWKADCTDR